jgi:hypothetical protein
MSEQAQHKTTRFEVLRRDDGWLVSVMGSAAFAAFVRTEREVGEAVVSLLRMVRQ